MTWLANLLMTAGLALLGYELVQEERALRAVRAMTGRRPRRSEFPLQKHGWLSVASAALLGIGMLLHALA